MTFKELDFTQQGDDWYKWRAEGIGTSDAATILGLSSFKSSDELLIEKRRSVDQKLVRETSASAREGLRLEPEALASIRRISGLNLVPACLENQSYPWMRCSVDGICTETKTVVEIKCGFSNFRRVKKSKKVPEWYYPQLQHILGVTGYSSIIFFCYRLGVRPITINCPKSPPYIESLRKAELDFWLSI